MGLSLSLRLMDVCEWRQEKVELKTSRETNWKRLRVRNNESAATVQSVRGVKLLLSTCLTIQFFFSVFAISFSISLNKSCFADISCWSAGSEIKLHSLSCNVNRESAAFSFWPFSVPNKNVPLICTCNHKCCWRSVCERHAPLIKDLCLNSHPKMHIVSPIQWLRFAYFS